MYDSARFFTVTRNHVTETVTTIATRQDALTAVHREYVQDDTVEQTRTASSSETTQTSTTDIDLDDTELIEKAKSATNGEKFERLWNGEILNYESQSEADMAFCHLLAFWTGGDQTRMDQLFRQSGLLREKWDEVHYADGSTYGEKTIERAVANTAEFYDPDSGDEAMPSNTSTGATSTDAERGESDRSRVYLTEKNRLLAERVDELKATLEQKNERIDTLEAEIKRLNEELSGRDRETGHTHEEQAVDAGAKDNGSETASVWGQTKRLFGSDSE